MLIMTLVLLVCPANASAQNLHLLRKIHHTVKRVHFYQHKLGVPLTKYHYFVEHHKGCHTECRQYFLHRWKQRLHHVKYKYNHQPHYAIPPNIKADFLCIHHYEGAWNANTGNGYYGGLQMDYSFQQTYGPEFYRQYGTANNWPPIDQLIAAYRAYKGWYHGHYNSRYARGFSPWPNTARYCGLL